MSDPHSDPRKELLRRMATLRASLDPKVLQRASLAAEGKVPYDKETAKAAVKGFLDSLEDGGRFKRKLADALKNPNLKLKP